MRRRYAFRIRVAPSAVDRRDRPRRHARRAPVQESGQRHQQRRVGRSCSFRTSAPTRYRLRPCRSMKVSSSDSTERRSFDTFMLPSLATNLAVQRARDTSARPDWTRTAASSSSSNPAFPRPTLVSDLHHPAAQARMALSTLSPVASHSDTRLRDADGRTAWCTHRKAPTDWWHPSCFFARS